ncbi:MAG: zinc ribbon domain-containing protein [Anaerolineaceae bacterium]|nr:zinc ribbon domain-containing protein [Anaerolineaceae bacterium]
MKAALQPLNINGQELSQLLLLAGGKPGAVSPLQGLFSEDDAAMRIQPGGVLEKSDWLDGQGQQGISSLSVQARLAMRALQHPKTSVQLVLGDLQEILVTEMYSAGGFQDDELVIFTERKAENRYVIRPGVSPGQVSDALLEHLMIGPRLDGLEFALPLPSKAALVFCCVLDWIHTLRLLSKLQNDRQISFAFTPQALWQRAMEIQMGDDLMWLSALLPYLFPNLEFTVSEEKISGLLDELAGMGYLDKRNDDLYYPNDFVISLADALVPMLSFGSCAIRQMEEELTGFHLAFVVGVGTNLVLEAAPGTDGQHWLQLTAVNGIELSKLLFRIGLPEDSEIEETPIQEEMAPVKEEMAPAREEKTPVSAEKQRFCTKCGAAMRPGVKFCTKCGHQQSERGG